MYMTQYDDGQLKCKRTNRYGHQPLLSKNYNACQAASRFTNILSTIAMKIIKNSDLFLRLPIS